MDRRQHWLAYIFIALCTWIATYSVLTWQLMEFGLTWDEPAYMRAALEYHEWLRRLWRG